MHVGPRVPHERFVNHDLGKLQLILRVSLGKNNGLCSFGCRKPGTVTRLHRCHRSRDRQHPTRLSRGGDALSRGNRSIPRLTGLYFLSGDRLGPSRIGENGDGRGRLAHGRRTRGESLTSSHREALRRLRRPTAAVRQCSEQKSSADLRVRKLHSAVADHLPTGCAWFTRHHG